MTLDSDAQRKLLLAIISDYKFVVPGNALQQVASEVDALTTAITQATLSDERNE